MLLPLAIDPPALSDKPTRQAGFQGIEQADFPAGSNRDPRPGAFPIRAPGHSRSAH